MTESAFKFCASLAEPVAVTQTRAAKNWPNSMSGWTKASMYMPVLHIPVAAKISYNSTGHTQLLFSRAAGAPLCAD